MTEATECRCEEDLDSINLSLNLKIYLVASVSVVQLIALLIWAILAMCPKDICKLQASKARRKVSREIAAEIEAEKRREAEVEMMELQMSKNRKARKAIRAEKAKDAKCKAEDAERKALL